MNSNQQPVDFLPGQESKNQSRLIPTYIENQCQCELCAYDYDLAQRVPMMVCLSQHNCCLQCIKQIIIHKLECPFCRTPIQLKNLQKNRMLCRILEQITRKKGLQIKINQNPQKQFYIQRDTLQNQQNNIPPDIDSILNEMIRNEGIEVPLINNQPAEFGPLTCGSICQRIQFSEPLYFFAYFLVMFYNVPFFICEINYALSFDTQACLDADYGVGINLRQWMFSSSLIGISMYALQILVILWKITLPHRKKCPQAFTVINIVSFFLKYLGYNLLGFIVYGSIDSNGQSGCSGSVLAYMEALLIIEIVIVCGICSLFDKRRR